MNFIKRLIPKPIVIVTALIVGIAAIVVMPRLIKQTFTPLFADIPQIEESSDPEFDYEFKASTFELLMGEEDGKPKVRIHQGIRAIDITVENQSKGQSAESIEQNPEPTPTSEPAGQTDSSPFNHLTIQPFNHSFTASAQENLNLVNTETQSTLEYTDQGFTLTPTLDIVTMEFVVTDKGSLPTLIINPQGLTPYNDVTEIVFQTRTNRKAFMFKNAVITDYSGTSLDSELLVQGHVTTDAASSTEPWYDLRFVIDEEWLSSLYRTYPLTITVEVESLFHERMLPVQPVKSTFKSYENLEFTIDTLLMEDPLITYAMETENFDKLRFGLIDTKGNTHELKWRVKEAQLDQLTIELWLEKPQIVAGLFDLLVQYEDNSAFIGEGEFSWGVLTINPDQSVYQSASPAKIDMAVLDKNGEVICDADLVLEITDPLGDVTAFSTETETITVTEGCFKDVTDLPDYTITYQTASEGIYKITLIAETNDGIFIIADQFEVDDSSPFYVKRRGPTRIYPLVEYDMVIEILTASVSGDLTVTEVVPSDFKITQLGTGAVQKAIENSKPIVWEIEIFQNSLIALSYTFDAPDISPAIFLLGPLEINYQLSNSNAQTINDPNTATDEAALSTPTPTTEPATRNPQPATVWTESRQWQIASDDTTGSLFPTADGSVQPADWYQQSDSGNDCNANTCWDYVEEQTGADTNCTVSDTDGISTYLETDTLDSHITFDIDESSITASSTVTDMAITPCAREVGSGSPASLTTWRCVTGSCNAHGTGDTDVSDTYTDYTETHSSLTITDLSDLEIGIEKESGARELQMTRILVDITFSPPVTGPTTDQVMRHGNWFDSGVEQGFFWAD